MTPNLNFYGGLQGYQPSGNLNLLHHCVALRGFLKKGKEKRKNSGLSSYEGLTPPSLSLYRPPGFLAKGKERRAESVFPFFYEGLTLPSLSLYRSWGF